MRTCGHGAGSVCDAGDELAGAPPQARRSRSDRIIGGVGGRDRASPVIVRLLSVSPSSSCRRFWLRNRGLPPACCRSGGGAGGERGTPSATPRPTDDSPGDGRTAYPLRRAAPPVCVGLLVRRGLPWPFSLRPLASPSSGAQREDRRGRTPFEAGDQRPALHPRVAIGTLLILGAMASSWRTTQGLSRRTDAACASRRDRRGAALIGGPWRGTFGRELIGSEANGCGRGARRDGGPPP